MNQQKNRFLKEARVFWQEATINTNRNLLILAEEEEKKYGKELSNFSRQEVAEMYASRVYNNLDSLSACNSTYKIYTDWCIENGLSDTGQNPYAELSSKQLDTFVAHKAKDLKIFTRDECLKYCQQVKNARDAFVLISLFEFGRGKSREEILALKLSDVDEEKMIAHLPSGRDVKVSSDWLMWAKRSASAEEFIRSDDKLFPYTNEGTIFKFWEKEAGLQGQLNRYISNSVNRLKAETNINQDVTAKSIEVSGIIHFVNSHNTQGVEKWKWISRNKDMILKQFGVVNFYTLNRDYSEFIK